MNKNQKIILAIFIPIIIFFLALTIAYYTGVTHPIMYREGKPLKPPFPPTIHNPFDWEKTWYIWLFIIIFVCIFEYKLFADKKVINNKKKKDNLS